jgi:glycosyltransferase involved in cell wall biosynthesis
MFIIAKTGWGGPQRHVFDLALGMKQKGHDVWVALSGDGLFKKKLEGAGIYTFSIAKNDKEGNLIENSSSFRHIYSVIKNKKPDVVHFHTPKEALIGSIASRMLGISKTFNTIHGWSFNEIIPVSQKISSRLSAWLSMFLCKTTIVCSEKDYHQAIHFPGTKNRLITIDPGIKSSVFFSVDGAKQAMSKILSMNFAEFSKKTTIGAIADLNQNKGINYLIEAMVSITEQHPNTVCIIIGDGSEKTNLKNLIEKHKLQDKVFLLGYLDNAGE